MVAIGLITAAAIAFGNLNDWLPAFIALSSFLCLALLLDCWLLLRRRPLDSGLLQIPFLLAHDRDVFSRFETISRSLLRISQNPDLIYRSATFDRLEELAEEFNQLASGTIEFRGTETWRIVYEQLLRSPGLHSYRSVAWVRNEGYWQSEPGRQSLRLNMELHRQQRVTVERIVILADEVWPSEADSPTERVRQWIHQQHHDGIRIAIVRESALRSEPDLLQDTGIYGSRAVGFQHLDDLRQPARFELKFDFDEIVQAEERWKRLSVYATPWQDFLDQRGELS